MSNNSEYGGIAIHKPESGLNQDEIDFLNLRTAAILRPGPYSIEQAFEHTALELVEYMLFLKKKGLEDEFNDFSFKVRCDNISTFEKFKLSGSTEGYYERNPEKLEIIKKEEAEAIAKFMEKFPQKES